MKPLIWEGGTVTGWTSSDDTVGILDLYVWVKSIVAQLSKYGIDLNHVRDDLSVSDQIDTVLVEYNNQNTMYRSSPFQNRLQCNNDYVTESSYRILDTEYTNNFNLPIEVSINLSVENHIETALSFVVSVTDSNDGENPFLLSTILVPSDPIIASKHSVKFIVPPGGKYNVQTDAGDATGVVMSWCELIPAYIISNDSSDIDNADYNIIGMKGVVHDAFQIYTCTPNAGWSVTDCLVDGESVGAVESYTFKNVAENHTIEFEIEED